jgi:hypothetical protein
LASLLATDRRTRQEALDTLDQVLADDRRNDLWPDGVRAGAWALWTQGRLRDQAGDKAGAIQSWRKLISEWPLARDHDGRLFATLAQSRLGASQ